jgi:hypothetical protein
MAMGLLRLATVGVLMFGGGVFAAEVLPAASPGLPLIGTQCVSDHCGPAPYRPQVVSNPKGALPPSCPNIAALGHVTAEKLRIEDATFTSVKAPSLLSDTSGTGTGVDTLLAEANRNAVVSTAAVGGHSSVVFVLFKCSTLGLTEQFVRVPVDSSQQITLETIRVRQPER